MVDIPPIPKSEGGSSTPPPPPSASTQRQQPSMQTAIAPGPHHLHKVTIILRFIRVVIGFVVAFLALLSSILPAQLSGDMPGWVTLLSCAGLALILALSLLLAYLGYHFFTWEITDSELKVRWGVISKKQVNIPYQRIHSLDSTATLLDRAFGLVTLNVQTAGSSKPEATLAGIKLDEAEALRSEIFARKHALALAAQNAQGGASGLADNAVAAIDQTANALGASAASVAAHGDMNAAIGNVSDSFRGVFGGQAVFDDEPVTFEKRISGKELFLSAISGRSTGVGLIVVLGFIFQFLGFFNISDAAVYSTAEAISSLGAISIFLVAGSVIVCALFVWAIAILSSMAAYAGFIVRRKGERIEVERGLMSHKFNGVAVGRIQSIIIKQGLIRRMIGYAEISVSTVSNVSSSQSNNQNASDMQRGVMLHPFIKKADIDAFLAGVLPEYENSRPEVDHRLPAVSCRRSFNHAFLWPTLFLACCVALFNALVLGPVNTVAGETVIPLWADWAVLAVIMIPAIPYAILRWKHARFGYNRRMLVMVKGAYGIETILIPRRKIQWMSATANPFQYLGKVETIRAYTAAGDSGTRNIMVDMARADAEDLIDWTRPHHAGTVDTKCDAEKTGIPPIPC